MNDERKHTQFKLRIPESLMEQLQSDAAFNQRTVTKEIIAALEVRPSPQPIVRTQIRLPADLHRFMVGLSIEAGRSLNSTMVQLLKQAVEDMADE